MPANEHAAKNIIVGVHVLAFTLSRPKNGSTNASTATATVVFFHAPVSRSVKKCVSSGRLPYQITRYCENVR